MAAGLIFVGAAGLWLRQVEIDLPSISGVVDYQPPAGRMFAPMSAIPAVVIDAFLAAEDGDFYHHGAVDISMMVRAMGLDLLHYGSGQRPIGASTITQQLVKNLIVGDEISLRRKIREALLALRVERRLSKDRILEIYLNEVYLGCRSHGVADAALNYFDKPLSALSIDEAAFLGGLPKGPSHYDPLRHADAAQGRRNWVIDRMVEDGYLAAGQAATLKAAPIRLRAGACRRGEGARDANAPAPVNDASDHRG